MRLTFNRLAEQELNDAIQYYAHEHGGLGGVVHEGIRRRLCQRFPYGVLYSVGGDEIRVLAVMNLKRRPNYWVGRT